jgi:putative oxidoreductase
MIKKFFSTNYNSTLLNVWLLAFRVGTSVMMLTHGMPKLSRLFGDDPIKFADPLGVGVVTSLALAVFSEFFCSLLLILGLGTRLAVLPLIFTMMVISFVVHAGDPFTEIELPLMYLFAYLTILVAGPGKYSVDGMISPAKGKRR